MLLGFLNLKGPYDPYECQVLCSQIEIHYTCAHVREASDHGDSCIFKSILFYASKLVKDSLGILRCFLSLPCICYFYEIASMQIILLLLRISRTP